LEELDPALAALNLPFFFDDRVLSQPDCVDGVLRLIDAITLPTGLRTLGMMRGADQLFVAKRPLGTTHQALQGLRIRVAGPGTYESIMRALGADPIAMPISHISRSLARAELDAFFTSPSGWCTQLELNAPFALLVPGLMLINYVLVIRADWIDAQSAHHQKAVADAASLCVTHAWQAMAHDDVSVLSQMERVGARITTTLDLPAWRCAVEPVRSRYFMEHPIVGAKFRAIAQPS
jgi:C4-dicarboxylate-binding protein DctP